MQIVPASVGAEIVLGPIDPGTISRLRKALRYPNPDYLKARKAGEQDPLVPRWRTVCEEFADGRVRIPRGAVGAIAATMHLRRLKLSWTDERSWGQPLHCALHGIKPRGYQEAGAEELRRNVQGLVVLPCGGGKTYLGIVAIAKIDVTTLVIVPTRDLVDQWAADVRKILHIEPAIFGTGKHNLGPLTVATASALVHHHALDLSRFGFVIYDEAHRIPARTRQRLLTRLPARYRLGLTATPDREDGQTKIVRWSFGDVLLEKTVDELVDSGHLQIPRIEAIHTSFDYDFPEDADWKEFGELTDALAADDARNEIICDLVRREPDQTWLILSPSRKAHARRLAQMLRQHDIDALDVTSDTPKGQRKKIMQSFRDGVLRVLVATSLADEGFDVKHLSRIVLALPEGAKGRTSQRLGRSMRPGGDPPIVFDLVDRNVDILLNRWHRRKAVYNQLGLEIRECPTLSLFHPATL